jgi:hypothetical protein
MLTAPRLDDLLNKLFLMTAKSVNDDFLQFSRFVIDPLGRPLDRIDSHATEKIALRNA